jgi:hypothetical protein
VGYELEFEKLPPDNVRFGGSPYLSQKEMVAIDKEIDQLLAKGAIARCGEPPGGFTSHIFARPKRNSSDLRIILNLKKLNSYLRYQHFKMENLDTILHLIEPNDWFISIDLKDAYFSVPIARGHRKYLQFQWRKKLYHYNVLCFGLATAPRVFTKCTKPFLAHFREKGFRISMYIDDILLMHNDQKTLVKQSLELVNMLESLGFVINFKKSSFQPSKTIKHLGFMLNSESMSLSLPKEKINCIAKLSKTLLDKEKVTIREVATILGHFNAYSKATKWGNLFWRNLDRDKMLALGASRGNFNAKMSISCKGKHNIRWWLGREVLVPKTIYQFKPDLAVFSDASLSGWGAHSEGKSTGGRWSCQESDNHINWLELKACLLALQSFATGLSNVFIHAFLDNTTAIAYINNFGGKIKTLNDLAENLWHWCKSREIVVSAFHIKGTSNRIADDRSRLFNDNIEWMLCTEAFEEIYQKFGKPDIDLFASRLNTKCKKFCSFEPDPECEAVNAFSLNWRQFDCCYAFPPFNLVGKVIRKMQQDQVKQLLLVCPKWPSQLWFPLVQKYLVSKQDVIEFNNRKTLLQLAHDSNKTHALWHKLHLCCFRLSSQR